MSNHTSGMLYKGNKAEQKNPLALYFQRVLLYNKKRPDKHQNEIIKSYCFYNRRNLVRCASP
nr:MAG TPA: hypothetical protein [Caudoviricetes sp.]